MGSIWVGMDAHKKAINVAALFPEGRAAHEWALENTPAHVLQFALPLKNSQPRTADALMASLSPAV